MSSPVKMSRKKKGSHVGLVLSFVVFITFLIFLYSLIEPAIKTQKDKQSLLDYLEIELMKNFVENMTTATIQIDEEVKKGSDCVKLQGVAKDIIKEIFGGDEEKLERLIFKNQSNDILNYSKSGGGIIVGTGEEYEGFLKIYYSDELEPSPFFDGVGCDPITGISVGLIIEEKPLFGGIIEELIEQYNTDYESLKGNLNLPPGTEFGFSFTYSNGTIIGTEEKEVFTSVYAREIPIQYIDEEANIQCGFLNIRIW